MRKFTSIQKSCGWPEVESRLKAMVGEKQTEEIFRKADALCGQYAKKYKEVRGIRKMHVSAAYTIAALYLPLCKLVGKEKAVKMLEEGAKPDSLKKKQSLEKMPARMFLAMCRIMTNIFFGDKAGFINKDYSTDKSEVRFDILSCPYLNTLRELGCPEVCTAICRQDEYSYQGMKNAVFERSQTLGNGDDKCDFCYRLK